MGTLSPEIVDRYVNAWHDVPLDDTSRAVAEECSLYCAEIDVLSGTLDFDDEPSDFRHARAGRRGWGGTAR